MTVKMKTLLVSKRCVKVLFHDFSVVSYNYSNISSSPTEIRIIEVGLYANQAFKTLLPRVPIQLRLHMVTQIFLGLPRATFDPLNR